jgi:hypothetical protein
MIGVLIRMTGRQLLDDFLKKYDINDFIFMLVSDDIFTVNEYKNVIGAKNLMPVKTIMKEFVQDGKSSDMYIAKYTKFLKEDNNRRIINSIVTDVAINDKNIVLLCSDDEKDYEYLKILCYFIEEYYKLPAYTYKQFKKMSSKQDADPDYDKEKVKERLKKYEINGSSTVTEIRKRNDDLRDKILDKLKKLEKKELIDFCKARGFKLDKTMKRKQILGEFQHEFLNKYIL